MACATPYMRRLVFKKFGERCFYCGTIDGDPDFTVDHVVPLSIGGKNVHTNMVPSCHECNSKKKRDKPPTVAQLHCLVEYWGVSHIPKDKFEGLANGTWKPLFEILSRERKPTTQRQKIWLRDPRCCKCGEPTFLNGGHMKSPPLNMACITNDEKGGLRKLYCWSCLRKRDHTPGFQLSRNKQPA